MIWFVLAIIFIVYFMTVAGYAGMETKFHLSWLVLAVVSTLIGVIRDQSRKGMIHIPELFTALFSVFCLIIILILVAVVLLIVRAGRPVPEPDADYLIVLGAHVNGMTISRALQNRLDSAMDYWLKYPQVKLILSGARGPGEDITEAEAMQKYLLHRGIPAENLILEAGSFSTEQNIVNSCALAELKNRKTVVVTNRFHLYRAMQLCKKQGMQKVSGLGAEDSLIMIPTYYLREVCVIISYRLQKKINLK